LNFFMASGRPERPSVINHTGGGIFSDANVRVPDIIGLQGKEERFVQGSEATPAMTAA
jgi:hypothetical protein